MFFKNVLLFFKVWLMLLKMYKYNVVIKGKSIFIFIMYFVIILKFLEYVIKFDYSVCN